MDIGFVVALFSLVYCGSYFIAKIIAIAYVGIKSKKTTSVSGYRFWLWLSSLAVAAGSLGYLIGRV